jgi:hypothetical protein
MGKSKRREHSRIQHRKFTSLHHMEKSKNGLRSYQFSPPMAVDVTMVVFFLPSSISEICSSTSSKEPTQNPSRDE